MSQFLIQDQFENQLKIKIHERKDSSVTSTN
jgi:hypothetical protein